MSTEYLITAVVVPCVGAMVYIVKEQTKALARIGTSLEHLANNVAYCPLNKKNRDEIKGDK